MLRYTICFSLLIFSLGASATQVVDKTDCDATLIASAEFTQAANKILPVYRENRAIIRSYINPNHDSSVLHQLVVLSLKLNERPEVVGKAFRHAKSYVYAFGMTQIEVGLLASFSLWLGIESGASLDHMLASNALLLTEIKLRKNLSFEELIRTYRQFLSDVHQGLSSPHLDYHQAQQLFLATAKFSISTSTIKETLNREMSWYHVSSKNRRQTCLWALTHGMDCELVAKNIETLTDRVLGRLSPNRHENLTYELALNLKASDTQAASDKALDSLIIAYNAAYSRTQVPFGKGSQAIAIKLFRLSLLKPTLNQVLEDLDRLQALGSFHRVNVSGNADYLDVLEMIYKGQI